MALPVLPLPLICKTFFRCRNSRFESKLRTKNTIFKRVAKVGSLPANAKMATIFFGQARICYIREKFVVFAHNCKSAMRHFLPKNHCFLPKKTLFCSKSSKKCTSWKGAKNSDIGLSPIRQSEQCPKKKILPPPPPFPREFFPYLFCFVLFCFLDISCPFFFYPVIVKTCFISFCILWCIW